MKTLIIYPDQQPAAAALAEEIAKILPPDVMVSPASMADVSNADLILPIYTLKQGSFAPTVARFREVYDKKVAMIPILTGEVERGRVMKTMWGSKKQFCGNHVLGAYLIPAVGPVGAEMVAPEETVKAQAFIKKIFIKHTEMEKTALAA